MQLTRTERLLILTGIALAGLNLRPLAGSLGPVLGEVQTDLGLSGTVAGFITTLPVVCFGLCGLATPPLAARLGIRRFCLVAMVAVTAGLGVRAVTGSAAVFVAGSALALAGVGVVNVLVPAMVKLYFPHRLGLVTGVYTTLLQLAVAVAAATAAPIAAATGSWRPALGLWALTSLVAALPWLGLLRERVPTRPIGHHRRVTGRQLARSKTAWLLTAFFAIQSANGYAQLGWLPTILRDAGVSETSAGLTLALIPTVGIVGALTLAAISNRVTSLRPFLVFICCCYIAGYVGLLLVPATVPWLWAALLGTGGGAFPVGLLLIGLRARTGQGSSALSGFVQGIGYLAAAGGPFLVGLLHDLTGGWTLPVATLLASTVALLLFGISLTRVRHVEDEITVRLERDSDSGHDGESTGRCGGSHGRQ